MNAFLTGSRAYGTPTEKSDIDLVVLMSPPAIRALREAQSDAGDEVADDYDSKTAAVLRFGKLNLLCVTTPEDFAVWREGTDELLAKKPVTRDEAVALFGAKRAALQAKRDADEAEYLTSLEFVPPEFSPCNEDF